MKRRTLLTWSLAGFLPVTEAQEVKWDVIVIGSGAAGLTAASSAREAGARSVLLIEKSQTLGGHTILSTGSVAAVDPKRQKPQGLFDSPERMLHDMLEVGGYKNDVELANIVCQNSQSALEWMERAGVTWEDKVMHSYGGLYPRTHLSSSFRAGYDYVVALNRHARSLGVQFLLNWRVGRILTDANGKVRSVLIRTSTGEERTVAGKTVVIATGGFTANEGLRMKFDPRLTSDYPTTSNPFRNMFDGATGDGLLMAQELGAGLKHAEYIQLIPFWGGRLLDYVGGDIFVNESGKRFVSECSSFKDLSDAILEQPQHEMWVITDANSRKGATLGVKLENKVVLKASSVEEMAAGMGIDPAVLAETLDRYNKYAEMGVDPDFFNSTITQTISTPPYYYGKEKLGIHFCCGGLRFSPRAEVLKENGDPIVGLYVAGEAGGGVHGHDRMGGVSITTCVVFGRIAGEECARFAGRYAS